MENLRQPRVLLIGTVLTLTARVARCLHLARLPMVVLGTRELSVCRFLPGCQKFIVWKDLTWVDGELGGGLSQLKSVCQAFDIDIVVPADYDTTLFLARHRAALGHVAVGPLPAPSAMSEIHNKWKLAERMRSLGVMHPRTMLAHDVQRLAQHGLSFPIITKPVDGSDGFGIRVFHTRAALEQAMAEQAFTSWPLLVQEYIQGRDVDISFVAVDGQIVAHSCFEHQPHARRFCTAPKLLRAVAAVVSSYGYTGVGHADSRYDPERDEYFLLEINPRFWGSLLYELNAGLNYPALYVDLAYERALPREAAIAPQDVSLPLSEALMMRTIGQVQRLYHLQYRLSAWAHSGAGIASKASSR